MANSSAKISFLRHPAGNGKIFNNSEAINSHLDKSSSLHGNSSIFDSEIFSSKIINSTVSRSLLSNCYVQNSILCSMMAENSIFGCELVTTKNKVINSHVLNKSRVLGSASLSNVRFKRLTVFNSAILQDWSEDVFDGQNGYIGYGIWKRPPRILRLKNLTITESVSGFAFVGCRHRKISEWLRYGAKIGKTFGVDDFQIEKIRSFLCSL